MEGLLQKTVKIAPGVFLFLIAASAHAQIVPCGGPNQDKCTVSDFFELLSNIFNLLIGLSAVVAILFMVLAGFRMLVAHWGETPESDLENAKLTLRRAVWGLIIILTAYLVVNTVLGVLGAGSIEEYFKAFRGAGN